MNMKRARHMVSRVDLLELCERVAMNRYGWFANRITRALEYTWILELMEGKTGIVLEIGAGTSPIQHILRDWGFDVVTIDKMEGRGDEWGSVEGIIGDFVEWDFDRTFDYLVSISVIEHMTATDRKATIEKAYGLLNHGGVFYLTTDLIKRTNDLWNKNLGEVIEEDHGTIEDVMKELRGAGFRASSMIDRTITGVATDLVFIRAYK